MIGTILQIIGILALALAALLILGCIWLIRDGYRQQKAEKDALYAGLKASLFEHLAR